MSESANPHTIARRIKHGLLPLVGRGIDVGAGPSDMPADWRWWEQFPGSDCRPWDLHDGDAHDLAGVPDRSLDWLYSSHCLEHLDTPGDALWNWVRTVRHGGLILLSVPHRDLYEGRLELPSYWNHDHRRFYVPELADVGASPDTVPLGPWLRGLAAIMRFDLLRLEVGDWNCVPAEVPHRHATGEYCIDALLVVH